MSDDKWVRRFSVDETAKYNGFTIYKITSVVYPRAAPAALTSLSAWRRYRECRALHAALRRRHAALRLPGACPPLPASLLRRFRAEVVAERARAIERFLTFAAGHRLLFASSEFVEFMQGGYPGPSPAPGPASPAPGDTRVGDDTDGSSQSALSHAAEIPAIPIYEAADVERRTSPVKSPLKSPLNSLPKSPLKSPLKSPVSILHRTDSLDSFSSLDSTSFYNDMDRLSIADKNLPDLINFDVVVPSTSTASRDSTDASTRFHSAADSDRSSPSRLSLSDAASATKTEDGYVVEAEYLINLATQCEEMRDYEKAFECYKGGIEKMLAGIKTESLGARREALKRQTARWLSRAELLHAARLRRDQSPPPAGADYASLARYKVVGVIEGRLMLALDTAADRCCVVKVVRKPPGEPAPPAPPPAAPYVVPLLAHVDTEDAIFLILSYAPGERLLDYVRRRRRVAAATNTNTDTDTNTNTDTDTDTDTVADDSVDGLVHSSRRLLRSVDRALTAGPPQRAVPASALRRWAAEVFTALAALHGRGVVCGDLHPGNILLGAGGQATLTYQLGAHGAHGGAHGAHGAHYRAPELARPLTCPDARSDYWSYGALMYELFTGEPLWRRHGAWTPHSVLIPPPGLDAEAANLLTQLLCWEPARRAGAAAVRDHPYFRRVAWRGVAAAWRAD